MGAVERRGHDRASFTWSYPDKVAIIGWKGTFAHPETKDLRTGRRTKR